MRISNVLNVLIVQAVYQSRQSSHVYCLLIHNDKTEQTIKCVFADNVFNAEAIVSNHRLNKRPGKAKKQIFS